MRFFSKHRFLRARKQLILLIFFAGTVRTLIPNQYNPNPFPIGEGFGFEIVWCTNYSEPLR